MISEADFDDFIETGRVSQDALVVISMKVINRQVLNIQEHAIFIAKTAEINNIIRFLKDKKNGDRN